MLICGCTSWFFQDMNFKNMRANVKKFVTIVKVHVYIFVYDLEYGFMVGVGFKGLIVCSIFKFNFEYLKVFFIKDFL